MVSRGLEKDGAHRLSSARWRSFPRLADPSEGTSGGRSSMVMMVFDPLRKKGVSHENDQILKTFAVSMGLSVSG